MSLTFFGIQLAFDFQRQPTLRRELHELIAGATAHQTLYETRDFWSKIFDRALDSVRFGERGTWDLVRDGRAKAEFESWTSEIEALASDDEATQGEGRFVLLTTAFLVARHSNADLTLGERCDVPETSYFDRLTFRRLYGAIPALNFANVRSHAVYLVPGGGRAGISEAELDGEGYEYLDRLR